VRFLDNPYFVPELKRLTGLDAAVVEYVLRGPETVEFLRRTRDLLEYVMPRYEREGKSYLTIAIGCTGGRHRSVTIADELARGLAASRGPSQGSPGAPGASITIVHRDVHRGEVAPPAAPGEQHARVERPSSPDDTGDRASAFELKGVTTPPPSSTAVQPTGERGGRG
jgi:UPF0042 nucleotide-binding protein